MRPSQHPDFDQAVLAAEALFQAHGWTAAFIEKDYYRSIPIWADV